MVVEDDEATREFLADNLRADSYSVVPAANGHQALSLLEMRTCDLVLVNKIDLLPHLDYDLDTFLYHLDHVHPRVQRLLVSARTGEGIDAWREWLVAAARPERALA